MARSGLLADPDGHGRLLSPSLEDHIDIAALHIYTVVFWWSSGVLIAGAAATLLLFHSGAVAGAPAATTRPALVN